MKQQRERPSKTLPRDDYSEAHRAAVDHPTGATSQSVVELADWYGNVVTWVIKTIRVEGDDTVFLQWNNRDGGDRLVLPPEVTAVLARHRGQATKVNRRRGARSGAATRKAAGIEPAFLKRKGE